MWKVLRQMLVVVFALVLGVANAAGQSKSKNSPEEKQIAVTVDDLPLNGPDIGLARLRTMTDKLLAAFQRNKVPVVGFVNESLLYVPGEIDARITVLGQWLRPDVELGNHTFSHLGFKNASLGKYEDDFIGGETVIRMIMKEKGQNLRYFRHPFLQMGNTREIEKAFEDFIAERGYKVAPVTIATLDWQFLSTFEKAKKEGDARMLTQVSDDYLNFAASTFDFCEGASNDLFGRQIRHILLLHANELNAENADRLFAMIRSRGYTFVTLEQALGDPLYRLPDKYSSTSNWLRSWAFSKGKDFKPPQPPDYIQKAYSNSQTATKK